MSGRIWYTSDPHFFHRTVSEEVRGISVEENNEIICQNWSKLVKPKDTVWILGDITVSKFDDSLGLIRKLPGSKLLICGNHDPVHPMHRTAIKYMKPWLDVFDFISPFMRKTLNKKDIMLSHFPYYSSGQGGTTGGVDYRSKTYQYRLPDMGKPLFHGHTHSDEKISGDRSINLCWEAWGRLVPQEELLDLIEQ